MTTGQSTDGQGAGGWTAAVRQRLGLGRLLPMGGPAEGIWLTEEAARAELRRAASEVPGVSLGPVRVDATAPDGPGLPMMPPPPGGPTPGPLRIEAEFTATAMAEPLQAVAERLRTELAACATERLGLAVTEVDLWVTGLREASAPVPEITTGSAGPVGGRPSLERSDMDRVAAGVPGVAYLTGALGAAVTVTRDRVRVECATAAGHLPLTVARAVRDALAATGHGTVTVLVTAVGM